MLRPCVCGELAVKIEAVIKSFEIEFGKAAFQNDRQLDRLERSSEMLPEQDAAAVPFSAAAVNTITRPIHCSDLWLRFAPVSLSTDRLSKSVSRRLQVEVQDN